MAEDDPRSGGVGGASPGQQSARPDYQYYGPYGGSEAGRPDPIGIGSWTAEETQPIPAGGLPPSASRASDPPGTGPTFGGTPGTGPTFGGTPASGPSYVPSVPTGHQTPGGYPAAGGYAAPETSPLPAYSPAQSPAGYPPPDGGRGSGQPPPLQGRPVRGRPAQGRPVRAGTVVAVAALTALVIGGGAGYAGSKLAARSAETTSPSASAPTSVGQQPAPSAGPSSSASAPTRSPVPPAPGTLDAVEVAAAALPSTVMIRVGSGDDGSIGSGFVLDDTGLIMTNNHVVADAADGSRLRVVFSDGALASASLVGRSPTYDIAVIRVKTSRELVPMPVGDSDNTQVGESVLAIGSPLGLPGTVTQGIISARNRPVAVGSEGQASNAYINGTQTDAPINPGNSGGPLLDAGGRVIGVNSAILTLGTDRQQTGNIGLGFAIPINQAMEIGKMLIADGKATYPVIGADVSDAGDLAGVRLGSVNDNGPADRAGLRPDDVVTKIDGPKIDSQSVTSAEELIVAVRSHRPGDQVTLTYRRDGQVREAQVTLGSREG